MSRRPPLAGQKILVTGPTGQVALPLALRLAEHNQVVGVARFRDRQKREQLEQHGVVCVPADLGQGDFSQLPTDFDVVLNFAVARSSRPDFDADLRANAEAAGLLMSHCRGARAFLHCSSTAVYQADDHRVFREDSALGDNHRVMMPTYSIAKIAAEAVVRTAARDLGLPTLIARLNTPYGDQGGWPFYHLEMMRAGVPIPVHVNAPSQYTPIHEDDVWATLPGLVEAASVPARIVNWCGQEHVSIEQWCAHLASLTGLEPRFAPTDATLESVMTDNTQMRQLAGEARVPWRDGLERMVRARRPELLP